jgi:hypothetical protein
MKTLSLWIGLLGLGALCTGCDGKCSGNYACPAGIPFDTLSTASLPSALVDVSADPPCTAMLVSGDGGAASVQVVDQELNQTLTCHLHGHLADGGVVTATVSFQAATIGCCPGYVASGGSFVPSDAGS